MTLRPGSRLLCAAGAGIGVGALAVFGPPGADLAAHVYQRDLFLHHGFTFWDNFWYAGRYPFVTYSLLYYPLAALFGIGLLGVVSAAVAAYAFAIVVGREWEQAGRWPAWAFAAALAASPLTGAYPYLLGLALALVALAALQDRRVGIFALLTLLTLAASPVAFALLAIVLGGVAVTRARHGIALPVIAVALTAALGAAVWRAFPSGGRFPFPAAELAAAVVFCGLGLAFTWCVERARVLRAVFGVYAAACLATFLVPSGLGENILRLRYAAVPFALLTLTLRGWRPLVPAVAAFLLALSWNVTPLAASFVHGSSDPSANASYWAPTIRFLKRHLTPDYRVEAVATVGHWEAVYLARAGIPIARGWFRQDDFPQNELLYDRLNGRAYRSWLRTLGVRYVVLTDAPPDYSARAEAALLRSGRSSLRRVFRSSHQAIYALPHRVPILTGPGSPRVLAVDTQSVRVLAARVGTYRLAIRYSPYWSSAAACIRKRRDGMIDFATRRAGMVELRFRVTAKNALDALAGRSGGCRMSGRG